jgi:hypothetical protein
VSNPKCSNCRHAQEIDNAQMRMINKGKVYHCVFNPPGVLLMPNGTMASVYPMVAESTLPCHQHAPIAELVA